MNGSKYTPDSEAENDAKDSPEPFFSMTQLSPKDSQRQSKTLFEIELNLKDPFQSKYCQPCWVR